MKANEIKFKVTNKDGVSAIISLDDLYGYEGEENGVFIEHHNENIPKSLHCATITYNGGTSDELDFEYVSNEGDTKYEI